MRLVEFVQARVPSGTSEAIISIAQADGVSPSEVIRRAILTDVETRRKRSHRPAGEAERAFGEGSG